MKKKLSEKILKSKTIKLCIIYIEIYLIVHARDTILYVQQHIIITKAHVSLIG